MIEDRRKEIIFKVEIALIITSIIWRALPVQKPPLAIPNQAALVLILVAILYVFLPFYYFPNWRYGKYEKLFNLIDFALVSLGIAISGGIRSILVLFYCPLIIENALFYGPLAGALSGLLASVLTIISSFLYSFFTGNLDNNWHSNTIFLLILHPFLGWLIGDIAKKEKETLQKEDGLPLPIKEKLTPREAQIIKMLLEGKTNVEIAAILNRSEKTIKNHCSAIYRKLEVSSRYELLALLSKIKKEKPESNN